MSECLHPGCFLHARLVLSRPCHCEHGCSAAAHEAHTDSAVVPWIWQVEVGNALGKAVMKGKVPLARAREIWDELMLLPIRQVAIGNIPQLLGMAVQHNLSLYDTCYLQAALVSKLPLATNDQKLRAAAEASATTVLVP